MVEQRRGRRIALTPAELDGFLGAARTCRVATVGPHGPHVSPLWFLWAKGGIWIYSITSSQRFRDLQRDPRISIVVDDGETFQELRGVEISGIARFVGEVPRLGQDVPELDDVEPAYARKYRGVDQLVYDQKHAWITVEIDKLVSWDFSKMAGADARQD